MSGKGFSHESQDKNISVEWYTPKWIFTLMRLKFDLDPCHPETRLPWIPVKKHYCIADNGLKKKWRGLVWLNPPYGRQIVAWLEKMHRHRNGMALVFARTDCKWFHDYCATADAILFISGRIAFVNNRNIASGKPGCGSMLVAWGPKSVACLKRIEKNLGHLVINSNLEPVVVFGKLPRPIK